jgi:4-alpha-glucanotransferase
MRTKRALRSSATSRSTSRSIRQDVWCNQSKFKLNADGSPAFVAGVPPDFFSSTGQLWGNPVYDWMRCVPTVSRWWVERVHQNLRLFDIARIDHFIGLTRAYEVPGDHTTAEHGEWRKRSGRGAFQQITGKTSASYP